MNKYLFKVDKAKFIGDDDNIFTLLICNWINKTNKLNYALFWWLYHDIEDHDWLNSLDTILHLKQDKVWMNDFTSELMELPIILGSNMCLYTKIVCICIENHKRRIFVFGLYVFKQEVWKSQVSRILVCSLKFLHVSFHKHCCYIFFPGFADLTRVNWWLENIVYYWC